MWATGIRSGVLGGINHHCTVVVLDGRGVMIEGRSGAGKTSLGHGLIERFLMEKKQACFVGDDQVFLTTERSEKNRKLIAHCPENTAGKAELYGLGIIDVDWVENACIDLLVTLMPDDEIERMPDEDFEVRFDIEIPAIKVPERHEAQAIRLVKAKLMSSGNE